jgi:hypothetical protein
VEIKIISRKKNLVVVSSQSDARRRYNVVLGPTANKSRCSCKRWIFGVKATTVYGPNFGKKQQRRRTPCKHILFLKGNSR